MERGDQRGEKWDETGQRGRGGEVLSAGRTVGGKGITHYASLSHTEAKDAVISTLQAHPSATYKLVWHYRGEVWKADKESVFGWYQKSKLAVKDALNFFEVLTFLCPACTFWFGPLFVPTGYCTMRLTRERRASPLNGGVFSIWGCKAVQNW